MSKGAGKGEGRLDSITKKEMLQGTQLERLSYLGIVGEEVSHGTSGITAAHRSSKLGLVLCTLAKENLSGHVVEAVELAHERTTTVKGAVRAAEVVPFYLNQSEQLL